MESVAKFLEIVFVLGFSISSFLYVVILLITVRKLRKNPETKSFLDPPSANGFDVIKCSETLAFPLSWYDKYSVQLSMPSLDMTIIFREHTNIFDKAVAIIFFWLAHILMIFFFFYVVLDLFGVFEN